MNRKTVLAAATFVAALALTGCAGQNGTPDGAANGEAGEENYPTDTITYIVPFPAGSAPDAGARIIAQQLEDELGVSVVIENREGGGSTIGLYELSTAAPDGYTIGLATFSGLSTQARLIDTPFEGLETVTPIARTNVPKFLMFASPERGWDSIEAFIEDAKSRPGEITVAIPNPGSVPDFQIALLQESAGIDLEEVYYDAGQQVLPVVNGTADIGVAQAGPIVQFEEAGDLDFIGVLGIEAPAGLDVASFDNEGYATAAVQSYEGVVGPAGLPENVLDVLSEAIEDAVESDEFQEFMSTTYGVPAFLGHEEFAEVAQETDEVALSIIEEMELN